METEQRCVVCDRGFNARRKPHDVGNGETAHKGCVADARRARRWLRGFVAPDAREPPVVAWRPPGGPANGHLDCEGR